MRSYRMYEQAVWTAYSRSETATCGGGSSDAECYHEGEKVDPRLVEASMEVLDTMAVNLKEQQGQFNRSEEAAERPGIRAGIGGLAINASLFFAKAAKGDFDGSLERISRCIEVFERFPGLCRLAMGAHAAHLLITALTAMEGCKARELYHTLRTAYNLPGTVPLPPLDEWHGISDFCEYFYCRAMERLIVSKQIGVFSTRTDSGIHAGGINGEDDEYIVLDGQKDGGIIAMAPVSSNCGGAELDLPNKYKGSPPLDRGEKCRMRSTLAPTSLFNPNGEMQAMNGGRSNAGEVAQAHEALLLRSPEIIQWGGVADENGDEHRLAAQDWLDAAHALLDTVADPYEDSAERA